MLVVLSSAALGQQEGAHLTLDRSLGLGIQAEFPWGGLISLRYWTTQCLGVEAVAFVLSNDGETSAILTARGLYRAVDASGGASFRISSLGALR
ncbi:MAG: hypothetical protein AB1778_05170 [Candidatus Bipolaricaulota bacterium]